MGPLHSTGHLNVSIGLGVFLFVVECPIIRIIMEQWKYCPLILEHLKHTFRFISKHVVNCLIAERATCNYSQQTSNKRVILIAVICLRTKSTVKCSQAAAHFSSQHPISVGR